MAYVDHAFSISDEDIMMDSSYTLNNRPPIKEIGLAVSLLVFGVLGIILGVIMTVNRVGGDRAHGNSLSLYTHVYGFLYVWVYQCEEPLKAALDSFLDEYS